MFISAQLLSCFCSGPDFNGAHTCFNWKLTDHIALNAIVFQALYRDGDPCEQKYKSNENGQ